MTPQALAKIILTEIVEANTDETIRQLSDASTPSGQNDVWLAMQALYRDLDLEQRKALRSLLQRSATDTASSILSVLDGNTYMLIGRQNVALLWNGENLSGELQDSFLELSSQ